MLVKLSLDALIP